MADQKISQLTNYATPLNADEMPIVDTLNTTTKKVTWLNIKATLKAYFDTLYPSGSGTSTGTNTGDQNLSAYATKTGAETLTNKRITKRTSSSASSATPTPDIDNEDVFILTALASAALLTNPTGTPTDGQPLIVRIKDNGTPRALTFDTAYRASTDLPFPTTTITSKTMYLGFIYNGADAVWDMIALLDNF